MAVQTRSQCFYCNEMVWTINNDITGHYKVCKASQQKIDRSRSSVKDWELKELEEKTKEWKRMNENK